MSSFSHWYNSIFHTLHAPRPPWRIHNPRDQPRPPRASFFPGSPSPSSRVTWLGAEVSYGVKASKPGYSITRKLPVSVMAYSLQSESNEFCCWCPGPLCARPSVHNETNSVSEFGPFSLPSKGDDFNSLCSTDIWEIIWDAKIPFIVFKSKGRRSRVQHLRSVGLSSTSKFLELKW